MRVKKLIKRTSVEYFGTKIDARKDHKYVAVDENGDIFSYKKKPYRAPRQFVDIEGTSEFLGEAAYIFDEWKESLRKVR